MNQPILLILSLLLFLHFFYDPTHFTYLPSYSFFDFFYDPTFMHPPPPASPVLLSSMPSDFPFFLHFPVLFSCTNHISFTPGFSLRQPFPCTNRSPAPFPRTSRFSPLSPAPFPCAIPPAPAVPMRLPHRPPFPPARFPFPKAVRPGHSRAGCRPAGLLPGRKQDALAS